MSIEELLDDIGGFGRFQVLIISTVFFNKLSLGWSMLQMSYAGFIPDWHCGTVGSLHYGNNTAPRDNTTIEKCYVNNTWTDYQKLRCDVITFDDTAVTAITEWGLLCDRKYIKALLTSIQMGGVLVGACVSGQLADIVGRKKNLYGFCLLHIGLNVIAAFSVSWEMFAVFRFLVGVGIGALLVSTFSYPMEFLPVKWRPLLAVLPVWVAGVSLFAIFSLVLNNWSHLHIACALCGLPGLVGYLYLPESVRWLTVHGRLDEAEEMCKKVASVNGREIPSKTRSILERIHQDEMDIRKDAGNYSYIDVFRGWHTCRITTTFCYFWFSLSLIYYGISFGVSSLAGNLYLNIFLLAIVEVPPQMLTFYFVNKVGRKWTSFSLLFTSCLSSTGCLVVHFVGPSEVKGVIITCLSLVTKMGVGAGWTVIQTWTVEIYPTVTRNLGYGAANTAARVGGIVAPFVIDFDDMKVLTYVIIAALIFTIVILTLLSPETKGKCLADSLEIHNSKGGPSGTGVFSFELQGQGEKVTGEEHGSKSKTSAQVSEKDVVEDD